MENDMIETRTAKIWLGEDGIVRAVFLPGAELRLDDAREISKVSLEITGGKATPFLTDIRKIKSLTREARMFSSREGSAPHRSAAAILVGSPVSRVIGNIYLGLNKPKHPVRLFMSEAEAIAWLEGFLE